MTARGLTKETSTSFRLGVVDANPWGHPAGRLAIPYLTRSGITQVKFRCISHEGKCDGHPKYLYGQGVKHSLFNVNAFFADSDTIVLCEGELDAISVQQATGIPAVAYPGVSSWQPHMARCFYGVPQVIVVADGDQPGRDAARDVASTLAPWADAVRIVRCPDGMDANSLLAQQGPGAVAALLGGT